jgi:hypothetical protein
MSAAPSRVTVIGPPHRSHGSQAASPGRGVGGNEAGAGGGVASMRCRTMSDTLRPRLLAVARSSRTVSLGRRTPTTSVAPISVPFTVRAPGLVNGFVRVARRPLRGDTPLGLLFRRTNYVRTYLRKLQFL